MDTIEKLTNTTTRIRREAKVCRAQGCCKRARIEVNGVPLCPRHGRKAERA